MSRRRLVDRPERFTVYLPASMVAKVKAALYSPLYVNGLPHGALSAFVESAIADRLAALDTQPPVGDPLASFLDKIE